MAAVLLVLLAPAAARGDEEFKGLTVCVVGPEGVAPASVFVEFVASEMPRESHTITTMWGIAWSEVARGARDVLGQSEVGSDGIADLALGKDR